MNLTDLLPPEKWLEFDMDFYERSGMNAYAFDSGGERIAGQKKWANRLCPVIKGNPKKAANICGLSHQAMSQSARQNQCIIIGECEAGLLKICVPVFVDREFVGIVGGCGLLLEKGEVATDVVEMVSGLPEEVVEDFSANIRHLTREETEGHARYLEQRVREIVDRAEQRAHFQQLKTFRDLISEVQQPGLCHQCGGCVTFCSAMNYNALEFSETGRPRFRDPAKCIECGICYMICPAVGTLDEQVKARLAWEPPMGAVKRLTVARARDPEIRRRATDGGAVTAILTHLFNQKEIDAAAVMRQTAPFKRQPWLVTSLHEVLESAGSSYDRPVSGGVALYSKEYSTFSPSVKTLGSIVQQGLEHVALVGTPCQIKTVVKMQTLGLAPADVFHCTMGLFCSGHYMFGGRRREKLESMGDFNWNMVEKVNIKDELLLKLKDGSERRIPLDELDFIKRKACDYCDDYSAEYADISFGGLGAPDGWTTIVARTERGQRILEESLDTVLEEHLQAQEAACMNEIKELLYARSLTKREGAAH